MVEHASRCGSCYNFLTQLISAEVDCSQVELLPAIADRSALNCTETS